MASVAGTFIGAFVGGAVTGGNPVGIALGAGIGAGIGGVVDQTFLFPAIFGSPTIEGPKLGDAPAMQGFEGSDEYFAWGRFTRVAGRVLWASKIKEVRSEDSGNDGKFGGSNPTVVTYTYFIDVGVEWARCVVQEDGEPIPYSRVWKILGDGKPIWGNTLDFPNAPIRAEAVTTYLGGSDQLPDPTMEAAEGAGEVPAYFDTCYSVIRNLELSDFGNRLPNLTAIISAKYSETLQSTIRKLIQRAEIPLEYVDVKSLAGCDQGGYSLGLELPKTVLESLALRYDLVFQDTGETVRPVNYRNLSVRSVSVSDTSAQQELEQTSNNLSTFTSVSKSLRDLPGYVVTTLADEDNDLQQVTGSRRRTNAPVRSERKVFLARLTGSAEDAREVSQRILRRDEAQTIEVELSLPPSYLRVRPGDVLEVPADYGVTERILVQRVEVGDNLQVQIQGVVDLDTESPPPAPVVPVDRRIGGDYGAPDLLPFACSPPAVFPGSDREPGFLVGCRIAAASTFTTFLGAVLFSDEDGTERTFKTKGRFDSLSVFGSVTGHAFPGSRPSHQIDRRSRVVVTPEFGSLSSLSDDDWLSGAGNYAVCVASNGDLEVISFRDAEDLGDGRFRLTTLLRGQFQTKVISSLVGSSFLLLSGSEVAIVSSRGSVGISRNLRVVAKADTLEDVDSVPFVPSGANVLPFAPVNLRGSFDGSGNWTIVGSPVTREAGARTFGQLNLPLDASEELVYALDVTGGRTLAGTVQEDGDVVWNYSASDQVSDFGSTQTSLNATSYAENRHGRTQFTQEQEVRIV